MRCIKFYLATDVSKLTEVNVVARTSPEMSHKTEEEVQLEEELRAMSERRKVISEITREADEEYQRICEAEKAKKERLKRIKATRVGKELQEKREARLETANRELRQTAELRAKYEAVIIENDRLRKQLEVLFKWEDGKQTSVSPTSTQELESLTGNSNNYELNQCVEKVARNLQRRTNLSKRQQNGDKTKEEEVLKLMRHIKRLEDEISAEKQIAVETQLRQLNELHCLTDETKELKKTLGSLHRQKHQQQQATGEHHQGNVGS